MAANIHKLDDKLKVDFYRRCLKILKSAKIPFLAGGAYAMHNHTGIYRATKEPGPFYKTEGLRGPGKKIDRERLLDRFGPHWRLFLGHLIIFGFVYPSQRRLIPEWAMDELPARLKEEHGADTNDRLCPETLLSREQYSVDVNRMGFMDPRLPPHGKMTREQIRKWDAGSPTSVCRQVRD